METVSVELTYSTRYKTVVNETDAIFDDISLHSADSDHIDELTIRGDQGHGKPAENAALGMGLIRGLQYLAQDYHAWRMLHEEDQITDTPAEEFEHITTQQKLAVSGTKLKTLHTTARQAKKAHLSAGKVLDSEDKAPVQLGAQLVGKILPRIGRRWPFVALRKAEPRPRPHAAYRTGPNDVLWVWPTLLSSRISYRNAWK